MLFRTNISWAFLHTTEALMLQVSGSAGKVTPGFIPHYTNQDLYTVEDFVKYRPEIIVVFLGSIEFVTHDTMLFLLL